MLSTQIRLKTLSSRTAATQPNITKTQRGANKKQNFYCTPFIAISLQQVFELMAQHHLPLTAFDALHSDGFYIFLLQMPEQKISSHIITNLEKGF